MTFRTLHTATFATIPLLGVLALHTAAAIPTGSAAAGLVGIVLGLLMPEDWRSRVPAIVTGAVPIVLAAGAALAVARGVEPVLAAVTFSVALQVVRVATRQGATHDPQIVILAILHLVSAAVLGGTVAFGACLLGFTLVAPAALTLSHLRREVERNYEAGAKDRAGRRVDVERILRSKRVAEPEWVVRSLLLAPFVLLFTGVLFLVVPRVGLAVFLLKPPAGTRMIGFSDAVDLGTMGELRANESLAARVEWEPPDGSRPPPLLPFYLRGTAFDAYDGRAWRKTDASSGDPVDITRTAVDVTLGPRAPVPSRLTVRLEPLEPTVLFLPNGTRAVHFEPTADGNDDVLVHPGPESEWRYEAKQPIAVRYQVTVAVDRANVPTTLSPHDRARYLQLPRSLDARMPELARTLTASAESIPAKAERIATHLREQYRYSTAAPSGGKEDPLAHFLFEAKAGHCEFFSTALVVLLRTQGIPARNVTGFAGAQRNEFGRYYSVRQQNAHAWVEYWHPIGTDAGRWELLDATPVATTPPPRSSRMRLQEIYEAVAARWDRNVAAFDLKDQADLALRVARPASRAARALHRLATPLAAAAGIAAAIAFALLRRKRAIAQKPAAAARPTAAGGLARQIETALAVQGTRGDHETMREYVARVCPDRASPAATALVAMYEGARWGAEPVNEADVRARLTELRAAVAAIPTRAAEERASSPSTP